MKQLRMVDNDACVYCELFRFFNKSVIYISLYGFSDFYNKDENS